MTSVIKVTIDMFKPLSEKIIQFDCIQPVYYEGYPNLLNILFENLIQNQINYSNRYIEIELFETSKEIHLVFKNDGQIVSLENYPTIFQPFSTRNPKGNGLGLEIVQEIVTLHGGEISLISDEKTTIFEIIFKRVKT